MQLSGAKSDVANRSMPVSGDIYIIPDIKSNTNLAKLRPDQERLREIVEAPSVGWLTTMDQNTGAGFYKDMWGPLIFAVGAAQPDIYRIFELKL